MTRKIVLNLSLFLFVSSLALLGLSLGKFVGLSRSAEQVISRDKKLALPTTILDIHGRKITEFFSNEKRELIQFRAISPQLVYALLTREDQDFFRHHGFSFRGSFRALSKIFLGQYFSGGSTLTQQLAGNLYADRRQKTLKRKIVELWWAWQLEKYLSKNEIFEKYINLVYFGHNTYGIESASEFYFNHSSRTITPAESAMLIIQLANPSRYSPLRHPDTARKVQKSVLDEMVRKKYLTRAEADSSFQDYWKNVNWARSADDSAFWQRKDRAPFFSEYIREKLKTTFPKKDINTVGYTVQTTLDLDYQDQAQKQIDRRLPRWNRYYRNSLNRNSRRVKNHVKPLLDLMSLSFGIDIFQSEKKKSRDLAEKDFRESILPQLELLSHLFSVPQSSKAVQYAYRSRRAEQQKNKVETALVTLDNKTGYILAMIGGSRFSRSNQFNRAVNGRLQPGSSFKPLMYSEGIESKSITAATELYDGPSVFVNPDGTGYTPYNYKGEWRGSVLARYALAHSLNVPAVSVLDKTGFDNVINRAVRLLGITDPERIKSFPRKYPLALGIISISPLELARAYATIANSGVEVVPLAIRYVQDRDGNIIYNPEKELRKKQAAFKKQILSPQTAYIMTSMLETTVESGTLAWARRTFVKNFRLPTAGKTGTVQNWSDVWTAGFSPYITTVVWGGFDQPGNSLGVYQTGAVTTGPLWVKYMKEVQKNLPYKDFPKPATGLVTRRVSSKSGLLYKEGCPGRGVDEIFLTGTEPIKFCSVTDRRGIREKASQLLGHPQNGETQKFNPESLLPESLLEDDKKFLDAPVLRGDKKIFSDESTDTAPESEKEKKGPRPPGSIDKALENLLN